jgi:hypothetical protein
MPKIDVLIGYNRADERMRYRLQNIGERRNLRLRQPFDGCSSRGMLCLGVGGFPRVAWKTALGQK